MFGRSIALAAFVLLAGCSAEPRSVSYFEEHKVEAEQFATACKDGGHRGEECANAQMAIAAAKRDARMSGYRKGF